MTPDIDKSLDEILTRVSRLTKPSSNGIAQINVSAGGVGLWVAVTACLVSMAISIVGLILVGLALSDLNRQTQELRQSDATTQAYLNAYFSQPKEPKE